MSRTFNEQHPTTHSRHNRFPNPFKDKDGKIERKTKLKPHGVKYHVGYGAETYFRRFGDVCVYVINKNKERKLNKIEEFDDEI